jgi:hypothetical protein
MKKSKKLEKRQEKRVAHFDALMSDPRVSSRFKAGAHRPGSGKRK